MISDSTCPYSKRPGPAIGLILLLCCLLLKPAAVSALGTPWQRVRSFSVGQGLPSSETYFVHQDRKGYLWFCTDRGLVRYDGYRLKVFTEKDGLMDNVVFKIYEDYKGRLWFLSGKLGLCYYENGRIVRYRYNHLIAAHTEGLLAPAKDVYIDQRNDDLYFSMYNVMSVKISRKGKLTVLVTRKNPLVEIWEADGEAHYYCVGKPYDRYKPRPQDYMVLHRRTGGVSVSYGPTYIQTSFRVLKYKDASFLITSKFLYMLRYGKRTSIPIEGIPIGMDVAGDRLWVGFYEKGVSTYRLTRRGLEKEGHLFDKVSVTSTEKDREGGYWFSTLEEGIRYIPDMHIRHLTARDGLASGNITGISGIGEQLYVVANHRQFQSLQGSAPVWERSGHNVILGKFNGTILVSWAAGFTVRQDAERIQFRFNQPLLEQVYRIQSTTERRRIFTAKDFYLVAKEGIFKCDGKGNETPLLKMGDFQPYYLPRALMTDQRERLYIGSEMGLFRVRNEKIIPHTFGGLLKDVRIEDLAYHPAYGSIAVTRGRGLIFFDGDRILDSLSIAQGMISDQLNFCYVDSKDRLWVGSNKGLHCIQRKDGNYTIRQYTVRNGLLTNEVNGLYEYNDRIWVATKKGITILDPEHKRTRLQPEIFLEELNESSHGKVLAANPVFEPGTTYVRIALRTTDFRGAPFHRFRYRFNKGGKWIMATEPEITLNNPKHGDYAAEVSLLDESGQWTAPKVVCSFVIAAPFYARWYFIAGLVLAGIAFGFLLFRLRLRQLSRRHQLQKTINRLEQKALRAQMNPHFIFNSLNSIQSFLIFEENDKAERYLLKFAHLIRLTLNNSRESYITIEAETEMLRHYLELEKMRFKDKFDFAIVCELSAGQMSHGIPPMLIQPFVENAVLHGFRSVEAGGKVEVRFESLEGIYLTCVVEDNGVGRKATERSQAEGHKSFGTRITAERLAAFKEKYGDDFTIAILDKETDGKPSGTKVTLRIPVVSPHEITSTDDI